MKRDTQYSPAIFAFMQQLKYKLLYLFLLLNFGSWAAGNDTLALMKQVEQLRITGDSLLAHQFDSSGQEWNTRFKAGLDSILQQPAAARLSFRQVKALSSVSSDNDVVKLLSWMLPDRSSGNFKYYAYCIIRKNDKGAVPDVYTLHHNTTLNRDELEFLKADTGMWSGCVYYDVVHKRYKKKDYYLLLGWAPQNIQITRKIVEPLLIGNKGIQLGAPVIKAGGKARSRLVFEFNSRATMSLRFDKGRNMLIMDHLSPSDTRPEAKGMYQLYGPDLSYDGLVFKKGMWVLMRDVDVTN